MPPWLTALGMFGLGAVLAIWATEKLLGGLLGLASVTRLSTFALGAILSGFEAENVAVGLAAGANDAAHIALGTVFGGATFLICGALGLGGILYPLRVDLPPGVLAVVAAAPLVAGVGVLGDTTPRWAGVLLLCAFAAAMIYVVLVSRRHPFLDPEEVGEHAGKPLGWRAALGLTLVGIVAIAIGGELVASGATRMVAELRIPAGLMGMVLTPAAIELEEVIRQAVPAREGRHEVSAGNLVGTLLYFVLFNLGLVALLTPVSVDPQVRTLDWPFLVGVTWLAVFFLYRGRVGRKEGGLLLAAYGAYAVLHLVL